MIKITDILNIGGQKAFACEVLNGSFFLEATLISKKTGKSWRAVHAMPSWAGKKSNDKAILYLTPTNHQDLPQIGDVLEFVV